MTHLSDRQREWLELGGLAFGLLLMSGTLRYDLGSDGMVRYQMLRDLMERHRLTATAYSALHPLAATPLYLLGRYIGKPEAICERFNLLVFTGMLVVLYRRLRSHLGAPLLRYWFLILAFCSQFPHHLSQFFTEVFSVALTVTGLVCLLTGATVAGGIALILGTVDSPACLIPLTLVVGKLAWDGRKGRRQSGYLWIPALALPGILLEAWLRRGSPFATGYEQNVGAVTLLPYSGRPGFSYPFVLGIVSILFSSGKGLLFFTPGLFLKTRPQVPIQNTASNDPEKPLLPRLQTLLLLYVIGLILIYARWWSWYGGWFWGPRFFLFASVPASLFLALRLRDSAEGRTTLHTNLVTLLALLLSIWVGIAGALFGQEGLEFGLANRYALEAMVWYVPEFSPLWHPLLWHHPLSLRDKTLLLFLLLVALWLAVPLLKRIAKQTVEAGRSFIKA